MELSIAAERVLAARYLQRGSDERPIETPEQMFSRVATCVARTGREYEEFRNAMTSLDFLPNSPTLMNAGTELGQLSACFVLPIPDSMRDIFEMLKMAALIQKSGGGVGFSFSRLRPTGDIVRTTSNVAGGPVPFIELFDAGAQCVKQGGKRFGANMGVLRVDHPDILSFIELKSREGHLRWFNLSVGMTDVFMEAVQKGKGYPLNNPNTGDVSGFLAAESVLTHIAENSWQNGEPGVLFLDTINKGHRVKGRDLIEATNPCGEQPLMPYESCNLGSINLAHFVTPDGLSVEWQKLEDTVRMAVRFLDSVIDRNRYPVEEIHRYTHYTRKIGLGVMGFHDFLAYLGVPYYSTSALDWGRQVAGYIREAAENESARLAEEYGPYPIWEASHGPKRRNGTLLTIAPTGSISTIAGCSSGIEPWFALCYDRLSVGTPQEAVYQTVACQLLMDWGKWDELEEEVEKVGRVADHPSLSKNQSAMMRTALEIPPLHHLQMQAAWQAHVDNAVSKTVNVPEHTTVTAIRDLIVVGWQLGCKGLTIYRDGSRKTQAQDTRGKTKRCPQCGEGLVYTGGKCLECPEHGPVECGI